MSDQTLDSLFNAIFHSLPSQLALLDEDGTIIAVNAAWKRFPDYSGTSPTPAVGTPYLDWFQPPNGRYEVEKAMIAAGVHAVMEGTSQKFVHEYLYSLPGEPERWLLMDIRPIEGHPGKVLVSHTDVSEQKRREDSLRRSETLFRTMSDSSPLGIFMTDAHGDCLYTNPAHQRMSGLSAQEAVGKGWRQAIHPEDRERVFSDWDRVVHQQIAFESQQRYLRKDASVVWIYVRSVAIHNQGIVTGFLGTVEDITERKHTEEALRQNEARFRAIFDQAAVGITQADLQYHWIRFNQKLCDILGYTREELMECTWLDYTHPDDVAANLDYNRRLLAGEINTYSMEKRYIRKNGAVIWVYLTVSLAYEPGASEPYFSVIIQDITERKRAEDAQRTSENRNRALLTAIPDLMLVITKDGTYRDFHWGSGMELLLPRDQIIGQTMYNTPGFSAQLTDHLLAAFHQAIATQTLQTSEYHLEVPSGKTEFYEARITALNQEDVLVIVRNITERKHAETALLQERTLLRTVIDNILDNIYVKDTGGHFLDANIASVRAIGLSNFQDLLGKTDFDLFPQELAAQYFADEQKLFSTGEPLINREEPFVDLQGNYRWHSTTKVPLRDISGKIIGLVGIGRNITEQKRAEAALRESEERYRTITGLMSDDAFAFRVNPDGSISHEWIVGSFTSITGYTAEEIGSTFVVYHPEDAARAAEDVQKVIAGQQTSSEYRIVTKSGETRWVHIRRYPVWDAQQARVIRFYGVAQDITERKRAEDALRKSESRNRALLTAIPDAMFVVSKDGIYGDFHAGKEIVMLYPGGQITGTKIQDTPGFSTDMIDTFFHLFQKAIQTQTLQTAEYQVDVPGWDSHIFEARITTLNEDEVLVIVRDITRRKRSEALNQAFLYDMKALQEMQLELSEIDDVDRLYFRMVELGQKQLGIDRLALFLTDHETNQLQGTYGVDMTGTIRDERYYREVITPDHWSLDILNSPNHVKFWEDSPLFDNAILVGKGWKVAAALWDGHQAIGYLVADNFISRQPARAYQAELISLLGSTFGHLIRLKQATERLRDSEARYRIISNLIWNYACSYRYLSDGNDRVQLEWVIGAFEQITGHSIEEAFSGFSLRLPVHPDDLALFDQRQRKLHSGQEDVSEFRILNKHGDVLWVRSYGLPEWDAEHQHVRRVYIAVQDISERKRAEAAEHRQRVLAEALRDTAAALNSTLHFDEVLDRILTNVERVVPNDFANIMMIERGVTSMVRIKDYTPEAITTSMLHIHLVVAETPNLKRMAETGELLIIPDVHSYPEWVYHPESAWIRSYVGVPIRLEGTVIGFLSLNSREPNFFTPALAEPLQTFSDQIAVAIHNARAYEQAQELAVIKERQRLARDLHDAVSQTLFAANITAQSLSRLSEGVSPEIQRDLTALNLLNQRALAEMNSLLVELRPKALVEVRIGELIQQLAALFTAREKIEIDLQLDEDLKLPADAQVAFYRIAQEGLNNISRHARASRVMVNLQRDDDTVKLVIHDNGRGFDPAKTPNSSQGAGMGISIMRERAEDIDADFTLTSTPGKGTELILTWQADHADL